MPHVIIFGLPKGLNGTNELAEFKQVTLPRELARVDELHITPLDVVVDTPLSMSLPGEPVRPEAIVRLDDKPERTHSVRNAAAAVVATSIRDLLDATGFPVTSIGAITQKVDQREGSCIIQF
jgi:hypothetical protein